MPLSMTTAGRDKASMAGAKRVVARQRRRQSGWRRLEQGEWWAAFDSGRRRRAAVAVAAGIPTTAPPGRATHRTASCTVAPPSPWHDAASAASLVHTHALTQPRAVPSHRRRRLL